MTSSTKDQPTRVSVSHADKKGRIAIDQIRSVDKIRIIKVIGKLIKIEIKATKEVIKETFVD